jgi:hypothetical protein
MTAIDPDVRIVLEQVDASVPAPGGISTNSAPGPETTGNNQRQSGKPDTRTGRPTRRRTARFSATKTGETLGQRPNFIL